MMRRPPRLLFKTMAVTFVSVAALLAVVFIVVTLSVRDQVRRSVTANLESGQRIFAALESRRQRELRLQAAALAENPRLKAAADTFAAEARTSDNASRTQWLETIQRELDKVAAGIEADAVVLADIRQHTVASAGRMADRWPRGRQVMLAPSKDGQAIDGVTQMTGTVFHVITVPFELEDISIGTLYLATALDQRYAEELGSLVHMRSAIITDGIVVASTLPSGSAPDVESAIARAAGTDADGVVTLGDDSYAYRRLVQVANTSFYALASIDESSQSTMRAATRSLVLIGGGGLLLALATSFWLARMLSRPVDQLSRSLGRIAASHDVTARLVLTGSSREVDALSETFNVMMASLEQAESETQAAYTGAIRALATALDARDPYTAGHSERVSVLSVAISRALGLGTDEIEVVRLGALLHDIGKIGVPDQVLRKPGRLSADEFEAIKEHPVLGARILGAVPFFAPHTVIVELHHERPDGKGYPRGLRGDDIPLAARIVHVADAYDAMTSARAYRKAMPAQDALRELWRCSGTEFHAEIVAALASALPGVTFESELVLENIHA